MTPATRSSRGRFERTIETVEQDAAAARLRAQGLTYQQIGDDQGCDKATAYKRVQRALTLTPVEAVDELRKVENERLDEMWQQARAILFSEHPFVQMGRVVPGVVDIAPKLAALREMRGILDLRAKLNGTYAPQKRQVTVYTEDAVDAAIRELEAKLAEQATVDV